MGGVDAAVLAPGYGGSAQQAIVVAMAAALRAVDIRAEPISFSRARPGRAFAPELDDVRQARDRLAAEGARRIALVGRSFGSRVCARLAVVETPAALVLLGHPIAPRNRPRPDDEAALEAVTCSTLIVQGDGDPLGPLEVLQRIARVNQSIELFVLPGVGHQFGARQREGIEYAAAWLARR